MTVNCLICGVGGQGTVLASRVIARAAMEKGWFARTAETIGMAQRGGSVVSHVRMGADIASPLIAPGQADIVVGFEPGEAVRCYPYLKQGGIMVLSDEPVQPVTALLRGEIYDGERMLSYIRSNVPGAFIIDGRRMREQCASPKVLNVFMLGAAAATGALRLSVGDIEAALRDRVPQKYIDMNLAALRLGAACMEGKG